MWGGGGPPQLNEYEKIKIINWKEWNLKLNNNPPSQTTAANTHNGAHSYVDDRLEIQVELTQRNEAMHNAQAM